MRFSYAVAAAALLVCTSAQAQLYFSEDDNGSGLYTLDTTTGAATNVGISGVTSNTVGLAPSETDGVLFGTQWSQLLRIATDGSGETIIGGAGQEGLAFDPSTGTLYGAINGNFRTIDPTTGVNAATLAAPGVDIEGLAWGDGGVYGLSGSGVSDLYFYDPGTDSWSIIGDTGIAWEATGLAFDPGTRTLYAVGSQDSNLYSIDPDTAATTLIGDTGIAEGGGLAFGGPVLPPAPTFAVPTTSPTGLALLTLLMMMLGWFSVRSVVRAG